MKRLKIKALLLIANKLAKKARDPRNAKGHYESLKKPKKPQKINKTIRNNYLSTKIFCKPKYH